MLALADRAHADRPYVVANMVESVDGRATVAGRSGPLGSEADRELFHALRSAVDAVFTGTGTLGAEGYGRLVKSPERRERRVAAGLEAEPIAVVVSRRGSIPWEIPLFAEAEQRVIVFSEAAAAAPPGTAAQVTLLEVPDARPGAVLARLRADFGIRTVLSEGGPTLLSSLVAGGVLDELFVTLAPVLAGASERPMLDGAQLGNPAPLRLEWLLDHEGELFLRYRVGAP